jgi:hypothetical protein
MAVCLGKIGADDPALRRDAKASLLECAQIMLVFGGWISGDYGLQVRYLLEALNQPASLCKPCTQVDLTNTILI